MRKVFPHDEREGCTSVISTTRVAELLRNGERLSVEFKRCSGRIEHGGSGTICTFDSGRMKMDIHEDVRL